jgi:hypothetical protein
MFKKHMTPLTKGGSLMNHKGKGSSQASMPNRKQIGSLANSPDSSINDYSKATPMAQPSPSSAVPGVGSGDWSGDGM